MPATVGLLQRLGPGPGMSQKSQSVVCVQGISIRHHSMAIISSSPAPPLHPHCWSAPPHPVIPQERREGKDMEWKKETGEQKDLRKWGWCWGVVSIVHKRCLDFASVRFVYLPLCVTYLCPSRRVHQRSVQSAPSFAWAPANSVVKERHLAVASALWAHFFPFLRSLRLSQTPPAQLADAAAGQ